MHRATQCKTRVPSNYKETTLDKTCHENDQLTFLSPIAIRSPMRTVVIVSR